MIRKYKWFSFLYLTMLVMHFSLMDKSYGEEIKLLSERIPAVSGKLFPKKQKLELEPYLGVSHNDAFFKFYPLGLRLGYHFKERIGIHLGGEMRMLDPTVIEILGQSNQVSYDSGKTFFNLELSWAPIYGKASLFAEKVLHFDTYFKVGAGFLGTKEGQSAPALTLAVGQHWYINRTLALNVQFRAFGKEFSKAPAQSVVDKQPSITLSSTVGLSLFFGKNKE